MVVVCVGWGGGGREVVASGEGVATRLGYMNTHVGIRP